MPGTRKIKGDSAHRVPQKCSTSLKAVILYKGLQGWDFDKETFGVSDRWSHMHIWMCDSSFVIRELYLVLCFENLSRMILAYRYLQVTRCQHISRCSCITRHHPVILSVGRASSGRTDHGS